MSKSSNLQRIEALEGYKSQLRRNRVEAGLPANPKRKRSLFKKPKFRTNGKRKSKY